MSRITNKNVKIGDNYVLPLTQSSISKYEAKVESLLSDVEIEKQRLLSAAQQEADNIKTRAELVVQEAEQKAAEIINNAKNESVNIIKKAEVEKEQIDSQKEELSKQAYDEGFQKGVSEGLEKFKQDAVDALKALDSLANISFDMKQKIVKSADTDIIELVSAIAKKVTLQLFDEKMLKNITIEAIKSLKDKEEITVIINPELVDMIIKLADNFRNEISQLERINIIEDVNLSCDGPIVETPLSRVDSRVSSQIDEIVKNVINGMSDDVQQE